MGDVVFLVDVDNTLLDNDTVALDLRRHLRGALGEACGTRYWEIFEALRTELGYADYLGALQRYRAERPEDTSVVQVSLFLVGYPFASRLYPKALDVLAACRAAGIVVILTDGDAVFQPWKISSSGLWQAVEGRVLVYIHKEQMLAEVARRYPAARYVLVDDKVRILAAVKQAWGSRVTTVFPRQGHYALDEAAVASYPSPDVTIERIGDLLEYDLKKLEPAS
jgi:FMN phosphatase YigB (HAD superfamily)